MPRTSLKAAGSGGKVVGAEEREEDGEDLWVAVYENRVWVVGKMVRECEEERIGIPQTGF